MNQSGNKSASLSSNLQKKYLLIAGVVLALVAVIYGCIQAFAGEPKSSNTVQAATAVATAEEKTPAKRTVATILDTAEYDRRMKAMANGDTSGLWPVKHDYPAAGAILPFNRV